MAEEQVTLFNAPRKKLGRDARRRFLTGMFATWLVRFADPADDRKPNKAEKALGERAANAALALLEPDDNPCQCDPQRQPGLPWWAHQPGCPLRVHTGSPDARTG